MPILERLPKNVKGRDYVVGDLHGSYEELCVELDSHRFDTQADRLIAVGDLIDRGHSSFQCLHLTKEPWFFTVWGNHESLMLRGLRERPGSDEFRLWMQNGGERHGRPTLMEIGPDWFGRIDARPSLFSPAR